MWFLVRDNSHTLKKKKASFIYQKAVKVKGILKYKVSLNCKKQWWNLKNPVLFCSKILIYLA